MGGTKLNGQLVLCGLSFTPHEGGLGDPDLSGSNRYGDSAFPPLQMASEGPEGSDANDQLPLQSFGVPTNVRGSGGAHLNEQSIALWLQRSPS